MGFLIGLFLFGGVFAAIVKVIEALVQGIDHKVPFLRMFNSRWAVTQNHYTYVFKGRWYAPTIFVKVETRVSELEAAKLVAKYANDNNLRGLPALKPTRNGSGPDAVLTYVQNWHESGGGKGGRVIEV